MTVVTSPVLFQNMPPLSPDEYAALEASIREHGVQVPILVDEKRVVIDGHHRKAIAESLGIECPRRVVFDKTDAEKRTLALTLNLDRRHLSREQRRAIVEASVKADPELSDRQHAARTGVSPTTVGSVRSTLESLGEVSRLDTRVGADGISQPATKPAPTDADLITGTDWSPEPVADPITGEVVEPERTVTGMDGKTYTTPASKPRRPALPDQFRNASLALAQKVEAIERLAADDRFTQNAEKVATANRSDLLRAIDALQRVVAKLS